MRYESIPLVLRKLARCTRGSSDLTVTLLLTAAGAAMVGLTVPMMFKSSDMAANTFEHQVQVLQRGAGGRGSGMSGLGGSGLGGMPMPSLPGTGVVSGFDLGLPGGSGTGAAPAPLTTGGGAPLTTTGP